MKKARENWLIKEEGRMKSRSIAIKEKKAHKILRNKKKLYIKNVRESIQEDQKYNIRKMYQTITNLRKDININLT